MQTDTAGRRGLAPRPAPSSGRRVEPVRRKAAAPGPLGRAVAALLVESRLSETGQRLARAATLLLFGLCLAAGATIGDIYLHRGVESGALFYDGSIEADRPPPYVAHPVGRDLAVNVDFRAFATDRIDAVSSALKQNGFLVVRQPFDWADIEPERGRFEWERYDQIVESLSSRGIAIVAVLAHAPAWARAPDQTATTDAPPVAADDYAAFVRAVVDRYLNRVDFVQAWDRPNDPDRWGGRIATAVDYLRLLAPAFNAARSANAETRVILAEFEPRWSDGSLGADLDALRAIYAAGGAPFFDIVAIAIDGGSTSPDTRVVDADRSGFARAILFRELLLDVEDDAKPIWMTHLGWNAGAGQAVSREEQAEFLVAGHERAANEWPWLGLMFVWSFVPPAADSPEAGFALLDAEGAATPAFVALAAYGGGALAAAAGPGYVPMESRPITYGGSWSDQHLEQRVYKTTSETGASATIRFHGTGVTAFLRLGRRVGLVRATLDGGPLPGWPVKDGASIIDLTSSRAFDLPILLASGLADEPHVLTLTLAEPGPLTIGGLVITRDQSLIWPVGLGLVVAVALLAMGLRDVAYAAAFHAGRLQSRSGLDASPPLPHLPDWQPARRA